MSTFTTPLELEYVDGNNWKLTAEFDFASETVERIIRVPVGFVTDFASVPRIFWNLLPPTGQYGKAAVIHDDLYRNPTMFTPTVTRKLADQTLREGMETLGVNWLVRHVIYYGVRAFGHWSFKG